jgi:E3 ubiquitin-protein ligase HUWE1
VKTASTTPLPLLPQQLSTFPSRWPFPRDDLYHWIPLLNRFDGILEDFCKVYGLHDGPQTRDFTCEMLERHREASRNLEELGYAKDGDRELVESVLNFSRLLLENCGNRTIYSSSHFLSDLLNSTSLSLVVATLQIGTQLAQRFQASFKKLPSPYRNFSGLLAIHYNINLDRVQQLAQPFVRTSVSTQDLAPKTPVTPSAKGKDKAYFDTPVANKTTIQTIYANDLVSLVKGGSIPRSSPHKSTVTGPAQSTSTDQDWKEWGNVRISYYDNQSHVQEVPGTADSLASTSAPMPTTPTPIRRSSTLGHQHGHRSSRLSNSNSEESPSPMVRPSVIPTEDAPSSGPKIVEITQSQVATSPIHELLKEHMAELPTDSKYELLTKLRVAKALTSSVETRRQILAVRILAITNLAYIHLEPTFLEKVMKQDNDEPRRLQLIYQLADMIHPPAEGHDGIPRSLQTIALSGLDALAHYQSKSPDICTALNTNVNHGVLLYIVRKAVAEMEFDEPGDKLTERDEWRSAVFSLLSNVATLPRAGSEMVTAGLVPILIDVLKLRTGVAERNYPMILDFLDAFIHNVRDAFQILVGADGLDAISNLIIHEVKSASEVAKAGNGLRPEYRSSSIDYQIPYYKQQSIKWLFKFIHHMMTTAGGYGGNFERLLRNLIDSPELLASLREIISDAQCFGSTVWTNAVRILNDFINNEPTSFAVIAEAGLSRAVLEAVTGSEIKMPEESKDTHTQTESTDDANSPVHTDDGSSTVSASLMADETTPHPPTSEMLEAPRDGPLARSIIPSAEAITIIPATFSAICLNSSGMRMFQASTALQSFFEVFESPKHVQCMASDPNLASNLGATFDELIRHHPPLKTAIINATVDMVARVVHLCQKMLAAEDVGAKLLATDLNGQAAVGDDSAQTDLSESSKSKGKERASTEVDMEMTEVPCDGEESVKAQAELLKTANADPIPYVHVVAMFLATMFSNSSVRIAFLEKGGAELVLDLAELPTLPANFAEERASRTLHSVISLLVEQKPHQVLPSLVKRAQAAADVLTPLTRHKGCDSYFAPFLSSEPLRTEDPAIADQIANGTRLVKAFVNFNSLTTALQLCFQTPLYNHRSSTHSFHSVNLTDYYINFVKSLGPLLAVATRESFFLTRGTLVPTYWKHAARVKDVARISNSDIREDLAGIESSDITVDALSGAVAVAGEGGISSNTASTQSEERPSTTAPENQIMTKKEREGPRFKNFKTLRHVLAKMPPTINLFLQGLGRILITKRSNDPYQRQNQIPIAEAIAETIILQLSHFSNDSTIENYNYWIVMFQTVKDILVFANRGAERPFEVITVVLQAFKERGGFEILNNLLIEFSKDITKHASMTSEDKEKIPSADLLKLGLKSNIAAVGIKHILYVYYILVTGKNISEAPQTAAMNSRGERDRDRTRSENFSVGQLVVELRMAVLPTVRQLWESDLIEKAGHTIPNRLIDIIRAIATADLEQGAHRRSEKAQVPSKVPRKPWKPNPEALARLQEGGVDEDLAKEALYRCFNNYQNAYDYVKGQNANRNGGRNPVPKDELDAADVNGSSKAPTGPSTGTSTPLMELSANVSAPAGLDTAAGVDATDQTTGPPTIPFDPMAMSIDSLRNGISSILEAAASSIPPPSPISQTTTTVNAVTIEDLNEERAKIREQLIDRCLDVINAHGEVTFEVSDLINTVVEKSEDPISMRKDMGETLVNALLSFAVEDDVREVGKKIAAYAHLLALMLQNKSFYQACIGALKENFQTLLGFVKLSPTHSSAESSPWIAHILLIIEILLSEDAQPAETEWKFPTPETLVIDKPVLKLSDPVVPPEERLTLFNHILEILPRIGKDESLALAVLRILVILTRARDIASLMGEKKNIQRVFVMAKQLAGTANVRLQSPLMLILRHIIEDDETVKQIMRSEIKAFFEAQRTQRGLDIQAYLRQLSHLAIRAPVLFVEVSNEMVKLTKWNPNAADAPGRQGIVLQDAYQRSARNQLESVVLPPLQSTGLLSLTDDKLVTEDVKPTTEVADADIEGIARPAPTEHKAPVVENPDGVIHFLLCELLNYKDVEDKEPSVQPAEKAVSDNLQANADTTMTDVGSPSNVTPPAEQKDSKKSQKREFKPEDHPIYIYRCFLLQCLTELLSSYNQTKVEFINFKRSAPTQAMTPSKPRSSVINYLLCDLIPIGTLDHGETIQMRKKLATSQWAQSVLGALLCKTGEQIVDKERDPTDADDEPDLYFVRKFVLENLLRAYKDASASNEPLDQKYARMLSLADLMSHFTAIKENHSNSTDPMVATNSGLQLRRIMFDKGFIAALTTSLADIDLNFPGAKRAVKHILKPLKTLTQTAIDLSDAGKLLLPPGQAEADEIESASSVSELEEEREETPDLFRNSTLGMFEPGRNEDSSSDSDDGK